MKTLFVLIISVMVLSLQQETRTRVINDSMGILNQSIPVCGKKNNQDYLINMDNQFFRTHLLITQNRKYINFIKINVKEVVNPDLEPLTFHVFAELPKGTIDIGLFSLYPANLGGIFRFRITEHLDKLVKLDSLNLIVKLDIDPPHKLTSKVMIEFGLPEFE